MALNSESFHPQPVADPIANLSQWCKALYDRMREIELRLDELNADRKPITALVVAIPQGGPTVTREMKFATLPGEGQSIAIDDTQRAFTVTRVLWTNSETGRPTVYAEQGAENGMEAANVIRAGVVNIVDRLDTLECRIEELFATVPQRGPNAIVIAYLSPDGGPARHEMELLFLPTVNQSISFNIDGETHVLKVVSVVHPEKPRGLPVITVKPHDCHEDEPVE